MAASKCMSTTFPHMVSSDDITIGDTHSNVKMAPAPESFTKIARLPNSFLESACNSTSDEIDEMIRET